MNDVIKWYDNNVNHGVNEGFLNHMIELGIINKDIDIKTLNSFLLESDGDKYSSDYNGRYKMKENRKPLIRSFENISKPDVNKNNVVPLKIQTTEPKKENKQNDMPQLNGKFKIQRVSGNKLKLIRL